MLTIDLWKTKNGWPLKIKPRRSAKLVRAICNVRKLEMMLQRRSVLVGLGALAMSTGSDAQAAMTKVVSLDPELLSSLLFAGQWSETAEDNGSNERLTETFLTSIVRAHASEAQSPSQAALVGIGVMVLGLSVAEWGVQWDGPPPPDPALKGWAGPRNITQGKHLMSYALGGIGLPHFDVANATRFFEAFVEKESAARADLVRIGVLSRSFKYDRIRSRGGVCSVPVRVLPADLKGERFLDNANNIGGAIYCPKQNPGGELDATAWQTLRHWSRVALRRRDMQEWIVLGWINDVWVPAYNEVMRRPHGSLQEAMVVGRVWSSSQGDALTALAAAGSQVDPRRRIGLELDNYGERSQTNKNRRGVMQRAGTVYEALKSS